MKKKLLASSSLLAMAIFSLTVVGTAGAASIDGVSDDSTARVNHTRTVNRDITNTITVTNTADVTNTQSTSATTGGNAITSDDDMSDVSLSTGDASAASVVSNVLNATSIDASFESSLETNADADADISDVSDESTAVIDVDETIDETVDNAVVVEQDATVDNVQTNTSSAGGNVIDSADDLDGADVSTGDASAANGVENIFNVLSVIWDFMMG